jgi:hypothetical protein
MFAGSIAFVFASLLIATATASGQLPQNVTCGTNIVSSTVAATYCSHRSGGDEMLDLMILWRGTPGWFQRSAGMGGGGAGGDITRYTTKGRINRWFTYGDVTLGFDADFDANTVKIGDELLSLESVNAVLVDGVDGTGVRRSRAARWIEPRLPLAPDMNVVVIQRSRELRDYLRCDIPMPAPPATPVPKPPMPVITVCEKLKAK